MQTARDPSNTSDTDDDEDVFATVRKFFPSSTSMFPPKGSDTTATQIFGGIPVHSGSTSNFPRMEAATSEITENPFAIFGFGNPSQPKEPASSESKLTHASASPINAPSGNSAKYISSFGDPLNQAKEVAPAAESAFNRSSNQPEIVTLRDDTGETGLLASQTSTTTEVLCPTETIDADGDHTMEEPKWKPMQRPHAFSNVMAPTPMRPKAGVSNSFPNHAPSSTMGTPQQEHRPERDLDGARLPNAVASRRMVTIQTPISGTIVRPHASIVRPNTQNGRAGQLNHSSSMPPSGSILGQPNAGVGASSHRGQENSNIRSNPVTVTLVDDTSDTMTQMHIGQNGPENKENAPAPAKSTGHRAGASVPRTSCAPPTVSSQNTSRNTLSQSSRHTAVTSQSQPIATPHAPPPTAQLKVKGVTYQLTQVLGRGGSSTVYKAQDTRNMEWVALYVKGFVQDGFLI
jgi:hypothetical protein